MTIIDKEKIPITQKDKMIGSVLKEFGLNGDDISIQPIHQGLINNTWKVEANGCSYIFQKINQEIFKQPGDLAFNISAIAEYLSHHQPGYFFAAPLHTADGRSMILLEDGSHCRVFPFVQNSHTMNTVKTAEQAYEAARQFGKFSYVLKDFDATTLKTTIPHFHNLSLRYRQFREAMNSANPDRVKEAKDCIAYLTGLSSIVEKYEAIKKDPAFKIRVTHHDAKISNVLFDEKDNGICVIDLDTVMPGYFISDVGDMMRTYLCPVSEEEQDLDKIEIRPGIYDAIEKGYMAGMENELTSIEKEHFHYAGIFMIYMQALRFLTDYLNNDQYYGASYPTHNLNRARNQMVLLEKLKMFTGS